MKHNLVFSQYKYAEINLTKDVRRIPPPDIISIIFGNKEFNNTSLLSSDMKRRFNMSCL
jgi:hypothetical protein